MIFPPSLLAAGLGAVSVLGFAPFEWFPLPILTLALLFRLWQRSASPRPAAWLGFCFGLGFFLAGVSWVYVSLHDVGGMAAPIAFTATLLFCIYLALFPALAGFAFRRLASADFFRNVLLLAGLWALTEWLRGWLLTGFPWLAIGYSQTPPSPLAGYAAVLGVYGIGFLVALIAAVLSLHPRQWRGWLAIVALLAGGWLLRGMDWTQPTGQPLTVSLLQGNVAQSLKWEPERLPLSVDTYTRLARDNPAALTVLPETAIPLFFDQIPRETLQTLAQHGDVLLGAAARHREGGYVNGAIAITKDGVASYAKRHLVPFGEYVPPGFSWFFDLVRIPMSNFSAGPAVQAPLQIAGQRIAPNICYEDLFGEEILASLPTATLLINLSNTAWFGDSLAQPQHLQIARLRAMETGRMMLRATNTGITAAIAPDGRVLGQLPPFTAGALRVEAQGYSGATPYIRWGNALALLLAICAVLPALLSAYRQRKSR
ncbi:MAG: apolipoprotein N-acyltransferase [Rhodocyclaceae bacterium]|nr:apolipoprotein N-acyltransferase [Rhodocyclaceae bacterium]MDZ4216194.1 apolipoprotein N-acyltransferase [Rhodocyclaceae bacterium]